MILVVLIAPALAVDLGCLIYCLTGGRATTHAAGWAIGTGGGGLLGGLICLALMFTAWDISGMTAGAPAWILLAFVIGGGVLGGIVGTVAVPVISGLRGGYTSQADEDAEIAAVEHIIEEHKQS